MWAIVPDMAVHDRLPEFFFESLNNCLSGSHGVGQRCVVRTALFQISQNLKQVCKTELEHFD